MSIRGSPAPRRWPTSTRRSVRARDIAFLGGIIRYILENDLWFRDFALAYTNIATIIEDGYRDPRTDGGVFSGFNADTGSYKQDTWQYKGKIVPSSLAEHRVQTQEKSKRGDFAGMTEGPPPTDPTLQHPNCVYQIMRRHYARYTPEMVERVTGCPRDTFLRVCEALTRNSGRERTGAFCYAVGWTHHTFGVQIIRAAAIIQGLLGNIGRPGGGMLALRGHCQHPGQHRHPDALQHAADLPAAAQRVPPARHAARIPGGRDAADRLVAQHAEIHGQPAEGLVRRAAPGRTTSWATSSCPS